MPFLLMGQMSDNLIMKAKVRSYKRRFRGKLVNVSAHTRSGDAKWKKLSNGALRYDNKETGLTSVVVHINESLFSKKPYRIYVS